MKDSFFRYEPIINVFMVDWMNFSSNSYPLCVATTELIGKMMVHFIREMKIEPQKIHLFGFSLGAHICGVVGTQFKNPKISRISGEFG